MEMCESVRTHSLPNLVLHVIKNGERPSGDIYGIDTRMPISDKTKTNEL